jgi:hypothetical protein
MTRIDLRAVRHWTIVSLVAVIGLAVVVKGGPALAGPPTAPDATWPVLVDTATHDLTVEECASYMGASQEDSPYLTVAKQDLAPHYSLVALKLPEIDWSAVGDGPLVLSFYSTCYREAGSGVTTFEVDGITGDWSVEDFVGCPPLTRHPQQLASWREFAPMRGDETRRGPAWTEIDLTDHIDELRDGSYTGLTLEVQETQAKHVSCIVSSAESEYGMRLFAPTPTASPTGVTSPVPVDWDLWMPCVFDQDD